MERSVCGGKDLASRAMQGEMLSSSLFIPVKCFLSSKVLKV